MVMVQSLVVYWHDSGSPTVDLWHDSLPSTSGFLTQSRLTNNTALQTVVHTRWSTVHMGGSPTLAHPHIGGSHDETNSLAQQRSTESASLTVVHLQWFTHSGSLSMARRQWFSLNGSPTVDLSQWLANSGSLSMARPQWISLNGSPTVVLS